MSLLLLVLFLFCCAHGSPCTDKCDSEWANGTYWMFCGTDGVTHNTTQEAVVTNTCYAFCDVSVAYVGACGCPNGCGQHGECVGGTCKCDHGWGGADCMSVSCPGNTCSGHGACMMSHESFCQCETGFTGPYCDVPVLSFPSPYPLWSDILPGSPPAYVDDKYGDRHPIINMSVIGTLHIDMPEDQYVQMILPKNLYNETYFDATMSFYNGVVRHDNIAVGVRAKGVSTILDIKKPFEIKFKNKGGFYGFKKIGLKNGSGYAPDDDSIANFALAFIFARAVTVPISRMSYTLVFLNRRFHGIYYWEEVGDEPSFLESRFGNVSGDLMKLEVHVPLQFFGLNLSYYRNQMGHGWQSTKQYYDEVQPGSLAPFVDMLQQLNTSISTLDSFWNTDQTIRQIAVESFFIMNDNFCDGNNFFCFRASGTQHWRVWIHDVDTVFESPAVLSPEYSRNVFEYGVYYKVSHLWHVYNPARAQSLLDHKVMFSAYMKKVLVAMFSKNQALTLPDLYAKICSFIFPWFQRDLMQQFAYNFSPEGFQVSARNTTARLWARYEEVMSQLS